MSFWSDPTDCLTEEEERMMEEAYQAECEHAWQLMMEEAFEALVEDTAKAESAGKSDRYRTSRVA